MLWILSSATSAGKQDVFFFFFSFFFFFFRAHWTHHKTRTCETFSPSSYFLWLSPPTPAALSDGYCFLVSSNYSNTALPDSRGHRLTLTHTHTHTHTHTQSVHICLAEFRCKMNGSSRITQQNEIMSRTWFHLHEPSKMCVRSGLEVFDFIAPQ